MSEKSFSGMIEHIMRPLPPLRELVGMFFAIGLLVLLGGTNLFGPITPGYQVNRETWTLQWLLVAIPTWCVVSGAICTAMSRNGSFPANKRWMAMPRLVVGSILLTIGVLYFVVSFG